MHRKEDELHVRYFLAKPHASIHAVEPRHRDVENDHIGPSLGAEIDKLVAIAGSADNFAPRLQQTPESVKEHRVIVSQKQSGAAVHLEGRSLGAQGFRRNSSTRTIGTRTSMLVPL